MSRWVKLQNNKIVDVIVANKDFNDTLQNKDFYVEDDGNKRNVAMIGGSYDATRDMFIMPKAYPSWVFDEESGRWKAPIDMPDDGGRYIWNELTKNWDNIDG